MLGPSTRNELKKFYQVLPKTLPPRGKIYIFYIERHLSETASCRMYRKSITYVFVKRLCLYICTLCIYTQEKHTNRKCTENVFAYMVGRNYEKKKLYFPFYTSYNFNFFMSMFYL